MRSSLYNFSTTIGTTILTLCLMLVACSEPESTGSASSEKSSNVSSNEAMANELATIAANVPPDQAWNANSIAADYYGGLMQQATGEQRMSYRFQYANQLLNAGKTDRAIEEFSGLLQDFAGFGIGLTEQTKPVYELLAVAYLRKGEEENCCAMHNPNSCFIPIEGAAIHTLRDGSEGAIQLYEQLLAQWPDDLQTRYLLNLAYMTLGEYPENVPPQYLIPDIAKRSNRSDITKFRDVAIQSKTDVFGLSGGAALDDFNNDGLLDIFTTSYGLTDQVKYLINNGDGTFRDHTEEAGLEGIVSGLNVKQADFNNDGFLDVLILRGAWLGVNGKHPNSLLRNNGDDTFTDVTRESGIYSLNPTQTAAWADFNLDGWVDLFIGNESGKKQTSPCELYINDGTGKFNNVAAQAGVNATVYVKGVSSGDVNGDGRPDLFLSVINGANVLYVNSRDEGGVPKFTDVSSTAGIQRPLQGFPTWLWDYDQDGDEDIFVASYDLNGFTNMSEQIAAEMMGQPLSAEHSKLYRNNGDLTFTDVTSGYGLEKLMYAMGSKLRRCEQRRDSTISILGMVRLTFE